MIAISRAAHALRAAAALLYLSIPAAWIIVPRLVASAYNGTSWPIFNDLISGQQTHPLQAYIEATASALFGFSIAALAIGALALTLSVENDRQAIKKYLTYILPLVLPRLSIVQRIAGLCGASVAFDTAPGGRGLCVSVRFVRKRAGD